MIGKLDECATNVQNAMAEFGSHEMSNWVQSKYTSINWFIYVSFKNNLYVYVFICYFNLIVMTYKLIPIHESLLYIFADINIHQRKIWGNNDSQYSSNQINCSKYFIELKYTLSKILIYLTLH